MHANNPDTNCSDYSESESRPAGNHSWSAHFGLLLLSHRGSFAKVIVAPFYGSQCSTCDVGAPEDRISANILI